MLELIVNNKLIYVAAGGVAALGVASKMVSNLSLKRMVKAAGTMSKSNHSLMKLVRAKFEHACMVSERVENVSVFVDKYLYEYRALGLCLHTWKRLQNICVALCLTTGVLGAFFEYSVHGMSDDVIRVGAFGGIMGVLLFLFQMTSDEEFQMDAARNYMVDYLENVCLHKYEKARANEKMKKEPEVIPETKPEVKPEIVTPPTPETVPPIRAFVKEEPKIEEKKVDKDVLIRQILEEFMA